MKFLVLAFCLVSVASGYKQFISVGGRNVISDNGGRGGSGSGGSGLSGASAFGGAGSGSSGASWSSGSSSSSWGGAGGRGGSKGLGGSGSLAALASPVNKYKASGLQGSVNLVAQPVTQVVNAAPSIPLISGGGYGGGYGGGQLISSGGGGGGLGLIGSGGWGGQAALASAAPSGGVITAAVITRYNVQYVDVPSQGGQPVVQQIVIPAKSQPLEISFESQSSPITVRQTHIPGQAAAPQVSSHQEEPDILKQEIVKPVIHEVIEAIQPFRKITQEVRPVIETVNQIISRGQQQQAVASVGVVGSIAKPAVASVGLVGSIAQPSASAVASNFLQKPVQFAPQSLDISIAKPQLAIPQISQVQPVDQAALAGNQLQQIQQITQQLIDKAKKAAAAKRAA